ncbi:MAG: hypothetical protein U0P30_05135 [Vicinamibacterales bacterium]
MSFGYGNAFEIRGRRLVNMTMPDQSAWRLSASLDRVLSLVRRRAEALPRPPSSDVELIEDLLR